MLTNATGPSDDPRLLEPGGPCVFVTKADADRLDALAARIRQEHPAAAVWIIHGKRHTSRDQHFSLAAATFQFPHYFGRNWDAFADCLHDLVQPGKAHLLLVTSAGQLLRDAPPADLGHLLEIVCSHHECGEGATTSFHVLLQEDDRGIEPLKQRLTALGAPFESLTLG